MSQVPGVEFSDADSTSRETIAEQLSFGQFAKVMERLSSDSTVEVKLQRLQMYLELVRYRFRQLHDTLDSVEAMGDSLFCLICLLLPHKNLELTATGLNAKRFARVLAQALELDPDSSEYQQLAQFTKPKPVSRKVASVSSLVQTVMEERRKAHEERPQELNLSHVLLVLDRLTTIGLSEEDDVFVEMDQAEALKDIYEQTSPLAAKWLTRIILQRMDLGLNDEEILLQLHPAAPKLLETESLEQVCRRLNDPRVVLQEEAISEGGESSQSQNIERVADSRGVAQEGVRHHEKSDDLHQIRAYATTANKTTEDEVSSTTTTVVPLRPARKKNLVQGALNFKNKPRDEASRGGEDHSRPSTSNEAQEEGIDAKLYVKSDGKGKFLCTFPECKLCARFDYDTMVRHVLRSHGTAEQKAEMRLVDRKRNSEKEKQRNAEIGSWVCGVLHCGQSFDTYCKLKKHKRIHRDNTMAARVTRSHVTEKKSAKTDMDSQELSRDDLHEIVQKLVEKKDDIILSEPRLRGDYTVYLALAIRGDIDNLEVFLQRNYQNKDIVMKWYVGSYCGITWKVPLHHQNTIQKTELAKLVSDPEYSVFGVHFIHFHSSEGDDGPTPQELARKLEILYIEYGSALNGILDQTDGPQQEMCNSGFPNSNAWNLKEKGYLTQEELKLASAAAEGFNNTLFCIKPGCELAHNESGVYPIKIRLHIDFTKVHKVPCTTPRAPGSIATTPLPKTSAPCTGTEASSQTISTNTMEARVTRSHVKEKKTAKTDMDSQELTREDLREVLQKMVEEKDDIILCEPRLRRAYTVYLAIAIRGFVDSLEVFLRSNCQNRDLIMKWYVGIDSGIVWEIPLHHQNTLQQTELGKLVSDPEYSVFGVHFFHFPSTDGEDGPTPQELARKLEILYIEYGSALNGILDQTDGPQQEMCNSGFPGSNARNLMEKGFLTQEELKLASAAASGFNNTLFCIKPDCQLAHNEHELYPIKIRIHIDFTKVHKVTCSAPPPPIPTGTTLPQPSTPCRGRGASCGTSQGTLQPTTAASSSTSIENFRQYLSKYKKDSSTVKIQKSFLLKELDFMLPVPLLTALDPEQRIEENIEPQADRDLWPKSDLPYCCLIAMALLASLTGSLTLTEILSFITLNFPSYKCGPDGWSFAVEDNLHLGPYFRSVYSGQREEIKWIMTPEYIPKMKSKLRKWFHFDRQAILEAIAEPGILQHFESEYLKLDFNGNAFDEQIQQKKKPKEVVVHNSAHGSGGSIGSSNSIQADPTPANGRARCRRTSQGIPDEQASQEQIPVYTLHDSADEVQLIESPSPPLTDVRIGPLVWKVKKQKLNSHPEEPLAKKMRPNPKPSKTKKIYPKPTLKLSGLISLALRNSGKESVSGSEIIQFICKHFPFFRSESKRWNTSIRRSAHRRFKTVQKAIPRKQEYRWATNPQKQSLIDEELLSCLRKNRAAILSSMSDPENLDLILAGELNRKNGDHSGPSSTTSTPRRP